jgi:hypothetical protein
MEISGAGVMRGTTVVVVVVVVVVYLVFAEKKYLHLTSHFHSGFVRYRYWKLF